MAGCAYRHGCHAARPTKNRRPRERGNGPPARSGTRQLVHVKQRNGKVLCTYAAGKSQKPDPNRKTARKQAKNSPKSPFFGNFLCTYKSEKNPSCARRIGATRPPRTPPKKNPAEAGKGVKRHRRQVHHFAPSVPPRRRCSACMICCQW